eukprot:gene66050-90377_t
MRKKLIAGNHKMNSTLPEGMQLAKDLYTGLKDVAHRVCHALQLRSPICINWPEN